MVGRSMGSPRLDKVAEDNEGQTQQMAMWASNPSKKNSVQQYSQLFYGKRAGSLEYAKENKRPCLRQR